MIPTPDPITPTGVVLASVLLGALWGLVEWWRCRAGWRRVDRGSVGPGWWENQRFGGGGGRVW